MIRMATAAAVLVLGLAASGMATAADRISDEVAATEQQIAAAEADYDQQAYQQVVETLAEAVDPDVYATLPEDVQYEALGLYARSLYRLQAFEEAHDAFVDLTTNPNATPADWALRADTAARIGDDDDAALAQAELEDDQGDDFVSIVA